MPTAYMVSLGEYMSFEKFKNSTENTKIGLYS